MCEHSRYIQEDVSSSWDVVVQAKEYRSLDDSNLNWLQRRCCYLDQRRDPTECHRRRRGSRSRQSALGMITASSHDPVRHDLCLREERRFKR
jgi:hypothetical protein